jgi:hypothetical protein
MPSIDNNRNVISILFIVLSTGFIIPLLAVHVVGYPTHGVILRGVPVLDSIFAELVELEPDPVVYPQSPVVETETSIRMESNYNNLVKVNESEAYSVALGFLSRIWYLSEINISEDSVDGGWTILDDGVWSFRFFGESAELYVSVNAISGRVKEFTSIWYNDSPFIPDTNESCFASSTKLEQFAFDFLNQFNYSLSPYARYVGPTLVYSHIHHHDVFQISFFNIVNDSLIWQNGIHLYLDVNASAIVEFIYEWVHIDAIPTESIISLEEAERSAVDYFRDTESVFEIRSTVLAFERMWSPSGYEYRLGWIVYINSSDVAAMHIDAKSGTLYNTALYGLLDVESPHGPLNQSISKPSTSCIIWIFLGPTLIAFIISLIVRRHTISFIRT